MNATRELQRPPQAALCDRRPYAEKPASGPVRVCFLIDDLARAGTEMQLLALIRHLDRSRVVPYLCLLRGESATSRSLEPDDCDVVRLGVASLSKAGSLRPALRFMSFLRREHIDVLQVYFPDSTYFGLPLGWLAGVPVRVRTRNNQGHCQTRLHRLLGRLMNRWTTHSIANCQAARRSLLADERPNPATVAVLENGVDVERFADVPPVRWKQPGEPRLVGAVANLRAVKGVDLLVEAARRVLASCPNTRFRVAGEGDQRPNLEGVIRKHELADRFDLIGSVMDIPAFLGELDVAVLCSRAEGMPNAVLEYMAAGRPIVATKVGAVAELIDDGVHGLLVPAGHPASLADAICALLQAPEHARALGEAARNRAHDQYSREAMVRRFERFYLSVPRRKLR